MDNEIKMVPASCTQCGGTVEVNRAEETAKCPFCGATFIIEKAVNNYNVQYAKIDHADNVTIDARGAVKEVLGFVGDQMRESRQVRQEIRKAEDEESRIIATNFFKIFGIIVGIMLIFGMIFTCISMFNGGFGEDEQEVSENADSVIQCYLDDGYLYTEVTGEGVPEWRYQKSESMGTVLSYEENDADGYHNCVTADRNSEGVRYVVAAAFDDDATNTVPYYYSVIRITIEGSKIVDAEQPEIVYSLSDYDFE